jgi:hypothetical protein
MDHFTRWSTQGHHAMASEGMKNKVLSFIPPLLFLVHQNLGTIHYAIYEEYSSKR